MNLKLGLLGASGRMGKEVVALVGGEHKGSMTLAAAPKRGESFSALQSVDVVLDFALPEVCLALVTEWLALPAQTRLPALVVGSTGWKPEEESLLQKLSARTPVLKATNFSIGVLALGQVLKQVSPLLRSMGYTPVLVEGHHRHKKDAPSGTALTLRSCVDPDHPETVQTHAIRAGEIIGDHEVTFHGPSDHLVFGHFAQNRTLFARGALEAVRWLAVLKAHGASGRILSMEDWFASRTDASE
jgi:4-hydroxy-tetrahydrodipicolinate reductase